MDLALTKFTDAPGSPDNCYAEGGSTRCCKNGQNYQAVAKYSIICNGQTKVTKTIAKQFKGFTFS